MSAIRKCRVCGGNIVEPAYPGDGAYPVAPMCTCRDEPPRANDHYAHYPSHRPMPHPGSGQER